MVRAWTEHCTIAALVMTICQSMKLYATLVSKNLKVITSFNLPDAHLSIQAASNKSQPAMKEAHWKQRAVEAGLMFNGMNFSTGSHVIELETIANIVD